MEHEELQSLTSELNSRSGAMSLERSGHRPGWVKGLLHMKNNNNDETVLPKQIREAVESLLNSLDPPEDGLRLAVRENRRLIRRAIERGATMKNLRKHFVAVGVKCSMEHLRTTLVAEGLWSKKNDDGNDNADSSEKGGQPVPA